MLGARRAGVTEAASRHRGANLNSYRRCHISITDRAGLGAASCECYRIEKKEFNRMVGV